MDYATFSEKLKSAGFVEHLKAEGPDNPAHWSRVTTFGGQIDKATGKKPVVYIDCDVEACEATMSITAFPLKTAGFISINRERVPFSDMAKGLKNFEQGIILAWREIAD